MRITFLIFYLTIITLMISCIPSREVGINVMKSSEIKIDSAVHTIVLVKTQPDFSTTDYNLILQKEPWLNVITFNSAYEGMQSVLQGKYKVLTIEVKEKASVPLLKKACEDNHAECAIAVNTIFINIRNNMQTVENDLGYYCLCQQCNKYFPSPAKVKYAEPRTTLDQCPYCSNYKNIIYLYAKVLPPHRANYSSVADMSATVSIYFSKKENLLTPKISFEDYVYVTRDTVTDAVTRYYKDYAAELCRICKKTDKPFEKLIQPTWETESRFLLYTKLFDFQDAMLEIDKTHWDHAAEIWKRYLNDPASRKRRIANHNMAVYYEMKDDLVKAYECSKNATKAGFNPIVNKYNRTVIRRIHDNAEIDKQLAR